MIYVLPALVVVWLVGDFIHSRLVESWVISWESDQQRDADGVLAGCQAYTVGDGPTALLLVHGINATPRHWENIAPRLAELGYTCRVMRLPGFGEPLAEYAQTTSKDWSRAIGEELRTLRAQHEHVGVVAHSLGGAATISLLIEEPTAADFCVLLAPAVAVSNQRSPLLSTRAWHEIGHWTLPSTDVLWSPFPIDAHDPAHQDHPGRSPYTPVSVVHELFGLMDRNRERAEDFRTPLLMVLTAADRVVDTQAARAFYERVASPTKELVMLDNSGHAILLDYDWPQATEAIDQFARQQTGGEQVEAERPQSDSEVASGT